LLISTRRSIKRIIFETIWKHDGSRRVKLSVSQLKQIAGRAGRYRTANQDQQGNETETRVIDSQDERATSYKGTVKPTSVGLVTCLDERDLNDIQLAMNSEPEPVKAAGLLPPVEIIDAFANSLPAGTPFEYLMRRLHDEASMHPRFFLCDLGDIQKIASCIDEVNGLNVVQSCVLVAAPADLRTDIGKRIVQAFARCVAGRRGVTIVDIPELPLDALDRPQSAEREYLYSLEFLHKSLILYLWLSYRFTNIFLDRELAVHAKEMVEERINSTLLAFSANPKLRQQLLLMRQAEHPQGSENDDSSEEVSPHADQAGLVEEDLSDSLNDVSALPVDWEKRPSGKDLRVEHEDVTTKLPIAPH
jgi:ATP-dependent RNA helicase SUPV3L1/SUV3